MAHIGQDADAFITTDNVSTDCNNSDIGDTHVYEEESIDTIDKSKNENLSTGTDDEESSVTEDQKLGEQVERDTTDGKANEEIEVVTDCGISLENVVQVVNDDNICQKVSSDGGSNEGTNKEGAHDADNTEGNDKILDKQDDDDTSKITTELSHQESNEVAMAFVSDDGTNKSDNVDGNISKTTAELSYHKPDEEVMVVADDNVNTSGSDDKVASPVQLSDYKSNKEATVATSNDDVNELNRLDNDTVSKVTAEISYCNPDEEGTVQVFDDNKKQSVVPYDNKAHGDALPTTSDTYIAKVHEDDMIEKENSKLDTKSVSLNPAAEVNSRNFDSSCTSSNSKETLQASVNESKVSTVGSSSNDKLQRQIPRSSQSPTLSASSNMSSNLASPNPYDKGRQIPSFSWSSVHERLLSDLLFAVENDIISWRRYDKS